MATVYKFRKLLAKLNFRNNVKENRHSLKKQKSRDKTKLRQIAYMVFCPDLAANFVSLFNCTTVLRLNEAPPLSVLDGGA